MRRLHLLLFPVVHFVSVMIAPLALAGDIVGQYTFEGSNPGSQAKYAGRAMIEKKGDAYLVGWQIGNQELAGTGILQNNTFAVVYIARNSKTEPGLVLYTILPNGMLVGKFTNLGGTSLGTETWTPVSASK